MIGSVEFEIRKNYKKLRPSERKVADYLLQNMDDVKNLTITILADKTGVSQPTIIRFANSIGIKGFKELKYLLMQEELRKIVAEKGAIPLPDIRISEQDTLEDAPVKVIETTIKAMKEILSSISVDEYKRLINAIIKAKNVFVFGVENSYAAVSDLVTKLLYLGINCITYNDYYLQSICASNLTKEDVAIGISYSGCSQNTVDVLEVAAKAGARTVAITNFENSRLRNYADINIVSSREQYLQGMAVYSRTSQLAIVDMIYTGVLISNYKYYVSEVDKNNKVVDNREYQE